jgi:hypothetical protein
MAASGRWLSSLRKCSKMARRLARVTTIVAETELGLLRVLVAILVATGCRASPDKHTDEKTGTRGSAREAKNRVRGVHRQNP